MNRTYGIILGAFLLAGASGCKAVKDRDGNDCEETTGEDATKCTTGSGTTSTADSETSTSDNGGDATSTGTTT